MGPTATGKTQLALSLASEFGGALISADSVQVYKALDIISGKDIPQDSQFINDSILSRKIPNQYSVGYYAVEKTKLYGVDIVDPTVSFSVFDYVSVTCPTIEYLSGNFLPILVGGGGFYIQALLDGMNTLYIPTNTAQRAELDTKTVEELQEILRKIDKKRFMQMNESDRNNKRRLIRSIEIATFRPFDLTRGKRVRTMRTLNDYGVLMIGLNTDRDILKKKIDERVDKRIKSGALYEAERLFAKYADLAPQVRTASGYRELFGYCMGNYSFEEAVQRWKYAEYKDAKKQMTWFKKDKRIQWFDITEAGFEEKVKERVINWVKQ